MKFIRAIEQLESGASERALRKKREAVAWGIIWADHEADAIDPDDLGPGESLALDLMVMEELEGVRVCQAVERITHNPADSGWVFDSSGDVAGRVLGLDGSMVSVAWNGRSESDGEGRAVAKAG